MVTEKGHVTERGHIQPNKQTNFLAPLISSRIVLVIHSPLPLALHG